MQNPGKLGKVSRPVDVPKLWVGEVGFGNQEPVSKPKYGIPKFPVFVPSSAVRMSI
jgi:hypothetical protein